MHNMKQNNNQGSIISWIDERFPLTKVIKEHLTEYYAPKNFNIWYVFGFLSLILLINQIISGIWLAMSYVPTATQAFSSVEYIMRDVNYGWFIRYLHTTGASFFFIVIYLHIFRSLLYGSHKKPRELVWIFGAFIFLCLMAEAFMGYLLPWGQMSYWGAKVITSLFGAIPYFGEQLVNFITGDYNISGATLNRFFALHIIALPLIIIGLVFFHIVALHKVGSNNPDGIDIKQNKDPVTRIPLDGIPFHPYYSVKDLVGLVVFLIIFCSVLFFMPDGFGYFLEKPNYIPANPMQTPEHIAPVWYFTPFYSILRAVPNKLIGVIALAASVGLLLVVPWLDRSPVRSIRYRSSYYKIFLGIFVIAFFMLAYLGTVQPTPVKTLLARICTAYYFFFFLTMPIFTTLGKFKREPVRVTK